MLKRRLLLGFVTLLVAALLLAALLWNRYQNFLHSPLPIQNSLVFQVDKGMYFATLAKKLEQQGLIDDGRWLRLLARLEPNLTRIRAGEYELQPGITPRQLLELFVSGNTVRYHFTLVEGTSFAELRAALAKAGDLVQALPELSDQQLLDALGSDAASPEGLFLAETYQFERGMSDLDLLRRAYAELQTQLDRAWAERDPALPLKTPYEALILASIIEKETGQPSERPQIAGVFIRRLQRGMRLQTDPTVIYGMGDKYRGNITRRDLQTPTAYNTYVIDGLPPTPIALVGPDAIAAALAPAGGKALYFVAKGDGSHQFSATLAEHNAAVARYQLNRRSDYRSSPGQ